MKSRNLALTAIAVAFSAIAAFPPVVQAADESTSRANQCREANDTRTQWGLPTVDCTAPMKTAGGVMGPVRTLDTKSNERPAMSRCHEANDTQIQWGLPTYTYQC